MTTTLRADMITTAAELAELILTILPEGYAFDPDVPTGGGCRAMVATAPDGQTVYLTDGDACLPFGSDDPDYQGLYFGYYDTDGDEDGYLTLEGEFTNVDNVRAFMASWVEGDPYRDIEGND